MIICKLCGKETDRVIIGEKTEDKICYGCAKIIAKKLITVLS